MSKTEIKISTSETKIGTWSTDHYVEGMLTGLYSKAREHGGNLNISCKCTARHVDLEISYIRALPANPYTKKDKT